MCLRQLALILLSGIVALAACVDNTTPTADDPAPTESALELFYESLQGDALTFAFDNGEWLEDFGDAAGFGPAYYLRAGTSQENDDYLTIAEQAGAYNLSVVEQATDNVAWYMDNLEEVFMASMGLVEYAGVSGDDELIPALDALIEVTDEVVALYDDYLEIDMGEFAADMYGPTSITAGLALIYLQYAKFIDNDMREVRLARAVEIVDAIEAAAWDTDHYRFRPTEEKLFLYPNATMMIVLNRLFELTGEQRSLDRVELVYAGIQPLHFTELGFYRSPYSQESQGAQTDEYSTLSSQNYLSLGLLLTYENTHDAKYSNDLLAILDHIRVRLYVAELHKILHHWIDGRIASEDDPEFFCSGCNLQTLYVLRYLLEELDVEL